MDVVVVNKVVEEDNKVLCKSFLMLEMFKGPHGHYLLKKGFLRVKYALNRFLVGTT